MHLHDLPPELLGEVLAAADNPNDLRSFISASPNCLQVFNLFRDRILLSVCLNSIEPGARRVALAVEHVPYLKTNEDVSLQRAFLDEFFDNKVSFNPPSRSEDIASFCSLVCRILYLIDDYAASAWEFLQPEATDADKPESTDSTGTTTSPVPATSLTLSSSERCAFQRGFFLFEVFAKAFPGYRHHLSSKINGDEVQDHYFLSRVQPWELEAMGCVFKYYQQVIFRHVCLVEDDFIKWVLEANSLFRLPTKDRPSPQEIRELKDKYEKGGLSQTDLQRKLADWSWYFFYKLDYELHGIDLFTTSRREIYEVTGLFPLMTSLRALYVYCLLQSNGDPEARMKLVVGSDLHFGNGSFFDIAAYHARARNPSLRSVTTQDDGSIQSTNAYALFRPTNEPHFEEGLDDDRALNSALRERAYIFWDNARLQQPPVEDSLQKARALPWDEAHQRYNNYFGPSVQERLDDIGIHHADAYPLFEKISGSSFYKDLYDPNRWGSN